MRDENGEIFCPTKLIFDGKNVKPKKYETSNCVRLTI